MSDAPHVFFTVDRTAYLRNLDREQIHEATLAIHYQAAPERLDENRVRMSMRAPILIVSQWPEDQQGVADKVADLLNKHWDDDEKPEPSCAGCGQPASEHLGKGECEQFLAPGDVVDKATAWDAATTIPPKAEKEISALREALADPNAVHVNMLRGGIARPSLSQIIHIYGADALRGALAGHPAHG